MQDTPDEINSSIDIDSDMETVYALIATPGWWINDGAISDNEVVTEGDVNLVTHAKFGEYRIRTVAQEPPGYAAFRWLAGDTGYEAFGDVPGTLVEFFVTELPDGKVRLRVRESGFTDLPGSDEVRLKNYNDNKSGWQEELEAARTHLEAV